MQNYAATSSDFTGFAKFGPYVPADVPPVAALKLPGEAFSGQPITLDASASHDPDGSIVNYAWDLDGDGSMETGSGTSATLRHAFGAGVHHIAVRVTDDRGERSYANGTVKVTKRGAAAHKKKKHQHKKHKHKHKKHKKKRR